MAVSQREPNPISYDPMNMRLPYAEHIEQDHRAPVVVWNRTARIIGCIAAMVPILLSVVALARINWDAGFDSLPVAVMDVAFTPEVAIATLFGGLLALAAAISWDRESKLAVGAILFVIGIGLLAARDNASLADLSIEDAHAWLAIGVGSTLFLTGLMIRREWWAVRRTVVS